MVGTYISITGHSYRPLDACILRMDPNNMHKTVQSNFKGSEIFLSKQEPFIGNIKSSEEARSLWGQAQGQSKLGTI